MILLSNCPGTTHERLALTVLVGPGGLAHEAESRLRVTHPKDGLGPFRGQFGARLAARDFLAEDLETLASVW